MKQNWVKITALVLAVSLFVPATILAQDEKQEKETKEKDKAIKQKIEKRKVESFTITRDGDTKEKVVIEINGDNVTINGQPIDEYKGGSVTVRRNRSGDRDGFTWTPQGNLGNWDYQSFNFLNEDEHRAMLGVVTEKADKGVEIQDITKESGAAKAGLKEGDVITRINDRKIEDPDDLSDAIQKHKPGEKVAVTYLRNGKEEKTTAELSKWKGVNAFTMPKMDMGNMDMMPKIQSIPRTPGTNNSFWGVRSGQPKLGLSVQDTDDGKGVKVIEVDDESTALKAGVKKDDVITEVDGKAVNSTDEISKIIKESKEKNSIMIKLNRGGKTQNIEVKMPKKIKTTDI